MSKRNVPLVLFLFLMLAGGMIVAAQTDCGRGLPCGPVPWRVPQLPPLPSPTQIPTIAITNAQANPGEPTATPTTVPTAFFDASELEGQIATLQVVMGSTPIPLNDMQGTPVDVTAVFEDMSSNTDTFFSYAKGVASLDLGVLTPLLTFLFTSMLGVIAVKLFGFALPIILAIFGLIRKVYHAIMEFLPF